MGMTSHVTLSEREGSGEVGSPLNGQRCVVPTQMLRLGLLSMT